MNFARNYTPTDRLLVGLQGTLKTLGDGDKGAPLAALPREAELTGRERRRSRRLMRVNHAGEVAAQGLYHGQALTARDDAIRARFEQAAREENDHLRWCARRVEELDAQTSRLDPLWYLGALAIGAAAGTAGDRWSLGFVAETERQVVDHLRGHLQRLPMKDKRSRAIVSRMMVDEARHAAGALNAGGAALPAPIRGLMRLAAKVMTSTSHWL